MPFALRPHTAFLLVIAIICLSASVSRSQTLQDRLDAQDPATLAQFAREQGDARRGAVLFYQPYLACVKCHVAGSTNQALGPDLTQIGQETSDVHLVEAVLQPSKIIRKGFEPLSINTVDGRTITGFVVDRSDNKLVIRDVARNGLTVELDGNDIEDYVVRNVSIMPAGQVNQLASQQQFLDLIRYLMEIRDGGLERARRLQPPAALVSARRLPEYESHIDHASMIINFNQEGLQRGEAIYARLCSNCHGTHDRPGTLPTSLPFASGKFKNGQAPYTMYQTLTRGFGMMVAQTWMVPQQKYDVIHYIREAYLKTHNPTQYFDIDQAYLDQLPAGDTRGPEPSKVFEWEQMDYGHNLVETYEVGNDATNFAYKGNAIRLDPGPGGVSQGRHWLIFDYDTLRVAAAWSADPDSTGPNFINWNGISFDGKHFSHPRIVGTLHLANPTGPGWANPKTGSFDDTRLRGRDGRPYGPLPRAWSHYKGMYYHGNRVLLKYTVGDTLVWETPGVEAVHLGTAATQKGTILGPDFADSHSVPVFLRTLNVGRRQHELILQVAHCEGNGRLQTRASGQGPIAVIVPQAGADDADTESEARIMVAGLVGHSGGAQWVANSKGNLRLQIPPGPHPLRFTLWTARLHTTVTVEQFLERLALPQVELDLSRLTAGGPQRWPDELITTAVIGKDRGPFAVDRLTYPAQNPWFCRMRLTGFDFFSDGNRAAVCSWDGSVWLVRGLSNLPAAAPDSRRSSNTASQLTWRRIASGLFQPLGLKIVDDQIYVTCRDQICLLHDLNGDGEIDFYENFNNDHQVTEHFHEFAMGLQTDAEGNFYYAKSARHQLEALVPQHGTLLRVPKDGSRTDILATGFRAANGVCVNDDGSFIVTDQQGHWTPANRINWVTEGKFYGNMFGYHDITDSSNEAMEQPLCWITNGLDRSPSELAWVNSDSWGPLQGSLLNFSYGYGKVYMIPHERIKDQMQGGMIALPIPRFPTGVMRGRFHTKDGQLYTCGMFSWASDQQQPGGFYRIRYTGRPVYLPIGLNAKKNGIVMTFTSDLAPSSVHDVENYSVKVWSLKRTAEYGSDQYHERSLEVVSASLSDDLKTITLRIPEIEPTWCMEIKYWLKAADGKDVEGLIQNTIHHLAD